MYALDCDISQNPPVYMSGDIKALCRVSSSINNNCFTWLSDPSDSNYIWGGMPSEQNIIEGVGVQDYYKVVNNVAVVSFSKERLYDGVEVGFNVRCGSETWSLNVVPQFADYQSVVGEKAFYVMDNKYYVVFIVFILLFLIILWQTYKYVVFNN